MVSHWPGAEHMKFDIGFVRPYWELQEAIQRDLAVNKPFTESDQPAMET
jgi:hypothetical protein